MAYNVLKGNVQFINSDSGSIESMVDDYSDQTIGGIKTFSGIMTASVGLSSSVFVSASSFHGDGAGLTDVIAGGVAVSNTGNNRVITSTATTDLNAETNLRFDGSELSIIGDISASINVSGTAFYGSAIGLTNVPAAALDGNVSAANIAFDTNSLNNNSGNLEVKLSSSSGLESTTTGIRINTSLAVVKASPANNDRFIISDSADNNNPKHMLYSAISTAIASGITTYPPGGSDTQIQFKNGSAFNGDAGLVYNATTDTLTTVNVTASGHVSASTYYGDGSNLQGIESGGSNAFDAFSASFNVVAEHDFIAVVTTGSAITASLPGASTFDPGKRFTFKDVSGSCSGSTNHIVISASLNSSGENIDGQGIVKIQAAYGSITITSDGVSQYYIASVN